MLTSDLMSAGKIVEENCRISTRIKMISGQQNINTNKLITSLMKDLGYKVDEAVCAGLVMMGIRAFFNNSIENYNRCVESIIFKVQNGYSSAFTNILNGIATSAKIAAKKSGKHAFGQFDEEIIEDMALLDGVALFQSPDDYFSWFNEVISQFQSEKIMPFTSAKIIKNQGNFHKRESWLSSLSEEKLSVYLTDIYKIAKLNKTNLAFTISPFYHRLGICYDAVSMSWVLINPCKLPAKIYSDTDFNNLIIDFCEAVTTKEAIFETVVYTLGKPHLNIQLDHHKITSKNIESQRNENLEVLFYAARNGYTNLIQVLAQNGESFNWKQKKDGLSPVFAAAQNNHTEILKIMASIGTDLNAQTNDGNSPAYTAASHGYENAIEKLANLGADLNLPNNDGWTPLIIAAQMGYIKVVESLIKFKVNLEHSTNDGVSAAYMAAQNGHSHIIKILHQANVNLNQPNTINSWTPLIIAAQNGHINVLKELFKAGIDLNYPKADGWTAALIAALNGNVAVLKILAKYGVSMIEKATCGLSPLEVARANDQNQVVEFIDTWCVSQKYKVSSSRFSLLCSVPKIDKPVRSNSYVYSPSTTI